MWKYCRSVVLCFKHLTLRRMLQYSVIISNRKRPCKTLALPIISGMFAFTFKKEDKADDPLISTMKRAILAQNQGNLALAEQLLHVALKMAQDTMNQMAITYVYDLMANVALESSQFGKAEKLFKSTLQRMLSSGYLPTDNSVIEISMKLAAIFSKTNRPNSAETGFNFCLDTLKAKIDNPSTVPNDDRPESVEDTQLLYGMCADWLAQHLISCKNYHDAEIFFKRSLQISSRYNGVDHPQTLNIINSIATVAALQKDFDKSLFYMKQVVRMASVTDDSLAVYYGNIGNIYVQMGQFDKAIKWCTKALHIAPSDHEDVKKNAEKCLIDARQERIQ